MSRYFFDTYSFFEIIKGNKSYEVFKECSAVTTVFQLAEFNYGLKKWFNVKEADKVTEFYRSWLVDVTLDDVKEAMSFRLKHKKMSIPDTIGYVVAKRLNIKFLTGDEDFKELPNVEFVK